MRSAIFALATLLVGLLGAPISAAEEYPVGSRLFMWAEPYAVGSFRHVGEIYFSRPVAKGAAASPLPRGRQIEDVSYEFGGGTRKLADYFEKSRTGGMIVLKDGKIVYERYLMGADERTLFTSWSLAKSFVSTLVGFAIGDGLIGSVDDPIDLYVPELKGSGYEGVPIKAILQMSSGIDFEEDYGAADSDSTRMWDHSVTYNRTPVTEFVRTATRSGKPFERFNYAGVETVALGWMLQRVTGTTLSDYLSRKIWQPLGMESDANWVIDANRDNANEIAFCCLNATLRDYARFGLLMADGGAWRGRQLLPSGWVDAATRSDGAQVQPGKLYAGYRLGYQFQWWTFPGDHHAFTGQGINGQFIYVDPAEHLVIVLVNVWRDSWDDILENETYAIFDAFAAAARD